MLQGHDIDPRLRDVAQTSNSGQEDAPCASTSSPSIQFPRTSQPSLQVQPAQHPQPYTPYSQSHNGPFIHAYYGSSPGLQYGQNGTTGDFHALPAAPAPSPPDSKRLRACEACRGLKVRCEPDTNGGPCKRCLKSGRKCEITAPSRKRQKKTDSRVSELEKQLADIQAQLKTSGQVATDGEGQGYNDQDSVRIESPDRRPINQSFYPQRRNGESSIGLDATMLFEDPQSGSLKHSKPDMDRNGQLEGPFYPSAHQTIPTSATPSLTLSHDAVMADVQAISRSLDIELAKSLISEFVTTMLPQKPTIGALLVDRAGSLQQSKPILFIAIMISMLQKWRKDTSKAKESPQRSDGSEKGNQALHLLSEVAMSNSGSNEDGEKEKHGRDTVQDGAEMKQHLAKVFVKKILDTDDQDAKTPYWFEELMQQFY